MFIVTLSTRVQEHSKITGFRNHSFEKNCSEWNDGEKQYYVNCS